MGGKVSTMVESRYIGTTAEVDVVTQCPHNKEPP
jgi:hypothetical protein